MNIKVKRLRKKVEYLQEITLTVPDKKIFIFEKYEDKYLCIKPSEVRVGLDKIKSFHLVLIDSYISIQSSIVRIDQIERFIDLSVPMDNVIKLFIEYLTRHDLTYERFEENDEEGFKHVYELTLESIEKIIL